MSTPYWKGDLDHVAKQLKMLGIPLSQSGWKFTNAKHDNFASEVTEVTVEIECRECGCTKWVSPYTILQQQIKPCRCASIIAQHDGVEVGDGLNLPEPEVRIDWSDIDSLLLEAIESRGSFRDNDFSHLKENEALWILLKSGISHEKAKDAIERRIDKLLSDLYDDGMRKSFYGG